jgi:PEP-CTERM motif
MKPVLAGLALLAAAGSSQAVTVLSEGFDNVSTLPASGWVQVNNSAAPVGTSWFQGNAGIFPAFSGAEDSYAAANFLGTGSAAGGISNWLILPALTLDSSSVLSFMVRAGGEGFLDTLEVRFSPNGSSTNVGTTSTSVGDFGILLGTYGADTAGGWESLSFSLWGLSAPTNGRLAFRYVVDSVATAGNYIGIDSVSVTAAVPEPATYLLMALGVAGLVLRRRMGA